MKIYYGDSSKPSNSNNEVYYDDSSKSFNSSDKNIELSSTTKEIYISSFNKDIELFFKLFEISLILLSPLILALLLSS